MRFIFKLLMGLCLLKERLKQLTLLLFFYCCCFSPALAASFPYLPSATENEVLKQPVYFFVCNLANVSAGSWTLAAVCLVTLASVFSLCYFLKILVWFLCERWLAHKCEPTHLIILF